MIEAVLFDLDGTLLDRRSSFQAFAEGQFDRFRGSMNGTSRAEYVAKAVELDLNGYAGREQVFGGLAEHFGLPSRHGSQLLRDFRMRFAEECVLFAGVETMLEDLRSAGIRLALVTNGTALMQGGKVASLKLGSRFDAILISDIEGVRKPEAEIFERAVQRLGVSSAAAVHVGDHPDADVRGAKNVGMKAVWRRDHFWAEPAEADATIDDIRQLSALVEGWHLT